VEGLSISLINNGKGGGKVILAALSYWDRGKKKENKPCTTTKKKNKEKEKGSRKSGVRLSIMSLGKINNCPENDGGGERRNKSLPLQE